MPLLCYHSFETVLVGRTRMPCAFGPHLRKIATSGDYTRRGTATTVIVA